MNIAGIDYSLRSPAICIFAGDHHDTFCFNNCVFHYLTDVKRYAKTYGNNIIGEGFEVFEGESARYDCISDWAIGKLYPVDEIALEGYSFGSSSKRLFQLAENTGLLKYKIYQLGIPLTIVTPSKVKKFATSKGNANKKKMYKSFAKETKTDLMKSITPKKKDVSNPVSDIVDSYYICKLLYEELITRES